MINKNPYEKNIEKRCAACGELVMVDQYGQGRCGNCNWRNHNDDFEEADIISYPNMVSLNKAIQLVKNGKSLTPNFEDFIEAYLNYGEMEFEYQGHYYGILTFDEVKFYEKNVKGSVQSFKSIEDFRENAHINGALLKELWNEVENAGYMST